MTEYYTLVGEWLLPGESGREPCEHTFDTLVDALEYAERMCRLDMKSVALTAGCDFLPPAECEPTNGDCGSIITTTKDGIEPWYNAYRAFRVVPLDVKREIQQ